MIRTHYVLVNCLLACLLSATLFAEQRKTLGIVTTKPKSGRFVEVDQGFMVPYSQTIPGTTVVFEMVPIPGGTFLMGSPPVEGKRSADEGPQIEVRIEPFWMGKYEVTWPEYEPFMDLYQVFKKFKYQKIRRVTDENRKLTVTAPTMLYTTDMVTEYGYGKRHPAATMTQFAARQYTKWLSAITQTQYRLPFEAEWEYACRAGTTTAFHFGDDAKKLG